MASIIVPSDIDFARYERATEHQAKMRPASSYVAEVIERFRVGTRNVGLPLPWSKTNDLFRFRKGEFTLWSGRNGSFKSYLQGMVMLHLCRLGERVAILSFEMAPAATLVRMTRQAAGSQNPSDDFIKSFHSWTDNRLWLYDHRGQIDPRKLLAVVRYAAELGITHLCIDSLMKVIRGEDDYNGQKDLVDALMSIAAETGMHIHLVHHLRKGDGSNRIGTKEDSKGSGSIADQVDNMLIVWRNHEKEEAERDGLAFMPADPDQLLIVAKQRNGEWEGKVKLYKHLASMQFVAEPAGRPLDLIGGLNV
jgi:twinkle protein